MGNALESPNAQVRVAPSAPSQARDTRSDDLKAAAIIGVVSIHAGWPYADVFRFGVPVFIAIWAFHYERGLARREPKQVWGYAASRFVRLLIPYALWTTIYLGLLHPMSDWGTTPIHTIVGGWFGGYGWAGQYFFIILFQLTWLMPLLRRWVTPYSLWVVLIVGILLNALASYLLFNNRIISGIHDRLFVYWMLYAFLGVAFARGYPQPSRWFLVGVLLFFAAPLENIQLTAANNRVSAYLLPTITLGSVALLLAFGPRYPAVAPSRRRSGLWIYDAVSYIGRHSFDIFVAHLLVLEGAVHFGFAVDHSLFGLSCKAALIGVAIGASLVLGSILRRLGFGILVGA